MQHCNHQVTVGTIDKELPIWYLLTTILLTAVWLLAPKLVFANNATDKHMGAATCANSQCHGKSTPQTDRNVQLNEYTIWIDNYHADAYNTLNNERSKQIAQKLGLPDAAKAKICLDCHTDNVPQELRGPKFQLSDGVGCEACHGGSERWLSSHTDPQATHQQNLANGMVATENVADKATVCLSCHQGNLDKFATHQIMAAGHPRLSFELALFSENQPSHYTVDDDYVRRKGPVDQLDLWLTGQIISAQQSLSVAKDRMYNGEGIFPDFAFFDCHSCHHSMSKPQWRRSRSEGVRPGSLRLHLPNVVVLESLTSLLSDQSQANSLTEARIGAIRAAQQGRRSFAVAADNLVAELEKLKTLLNTNNSRRDIDQIMKSLLNSASADQARDYADAEQLYYSYETLCLESVRIDQCEPVLDKLFDYLNDEDSFTPGAFANGAKRLGGKAQKRTVTTIPAESNKGRLTVVTTPPNARVRIMNIAPKYIDGIELNIGAQYDIEVSEDGYKGFRQKIILSDDTQTLDVVLDLQ